ncbi:MAG: sigma-70 family RNA polymerase sigma factor [Candidatus Omnitrophica bacterium]|nr:sigma-70 family RNA polymerase sigma factor [Candidatus Omnitrophota bacterium]
MPTDLEIIEAVLRGQVDRFAELVDRYQRAAWQAAFGFLGNFEDAKEASQNGFVKAYRHLKGFQGRSKFSTWLYRIVANECKDFLRKKARQPGFVSLVLGGDEEGEEMELLETADPKGGPRERLEEAELNRVLSRAIGRLPGKQKEAFLLLHLTGLPYEEVSQVMGCRVGTVKSHVSRAVETLRVMMEPYLKEGAASHA